MIIKMLYTRRGTEDGFKIRLFREGETYDVRDHLAFTLRDIGACEIISKSPERYDDYLYKNFQFAVQ